MNDNITTYNGEKNFLVQAVGIEFTPKTFGLQKLKAKVKS